MVSTASAGTGACGRLRPPASPVVASVPVRPVAEYPHCDAAIDTAHLGLADYGRAVTMAAMCGRSTLRTPWEEVAAVFALDGPAHNLRPRYNTARASQRRRCAPKGRSASSRCCGEGGGHLCVFPATASAAGSRRRCCQRSSLPFRRRSLWRILKYVLLRTGEPRSLPSAARNRSSPS